MIKASTLKAIALIALTFSHFNSISFAQVNTPTRPAPVRAPTTSFPLRVMTYNARMISCVNILNVGSIFKGLSFCDDSGSYWDDDLVNRISALKSFLHSQFLSSSGPDVVLMQEIWQGPLLNQSTTQLLTESLAQTGYQHIVYGPPATITSIWDVITEGQTHGIYNSGLAILSKYKIVSVASTYYDEGCVDQDCYAATGMLKVRVELPNGRGNVDLFTTQAQAFANGESIRVAQMQRLNNFIHSEPLAPIAILAGDFNTYDIPQRQGSLQNLLAIGFTQSAQECLTLSSACTLTGPNAKSYANNGDLDYIFYHTEGPISITPTSFTPILVPQIVWQGQSYPLSDHNPILASLMVNAGN